MSTPSTYGIGPAIRGPANVGTSLIDMGARQKADGMQILGNAAEGEMRRDMANDRQGLENDAGNAQLLSTLGAAGGFAVGGPVGGLIGGALGGIAAKLF